MLKGLKGLLTNSEEIATLNKKIDYVRKDLARFNDKVDAEFDLLGRFAGTLDNMKSNMNGHVVLKKLVEEQVSGVNELVHSVKKRDGLVNTAQLNKILDEHRAVMTAVCEQNVQNATRITNKLTTIFQKLSVDINQRLEECEQRNEALFEQFRGVLELLNERLSATETPVQAETPQPVAQEEKEFLQTKEVQELLGVSGTSVNRYRSGKVPAGKPPFPQAVGRNAEGKYYLREDIVAWKNAPVN